MATYTTREAAEKAGIHYITLHRLIATRKITAPPLRKVKGGSTVRLWSERDIKRLTRYRTEHPKGRPPKRRRSVRIHKPKDFELEGYSVQEGPKGFNVYGPEDKFPVKTFKTFRGAKNWVNRAHRADRMKG